MAKLNGKTILITGASRGIGRCIALRCAQDGANIVIAAKSSDPHPKLPGTIHTVAKEVEEVGGQALALQVDVREDDQISGMIEQTVERFGGVDAIINNAGAIKLVGCETLPLKRFDLMHQINTRAILASAQAALPYLKKSEQGHIINLSPPINLDPKWFAQYGPYTLTKYGMSMLTISMAAEFKKYGIAVNSLWPQTLIATSAVEFEAGGAAALDRARKPEIMSDAAYEILTTANCELSGEFVIDEKLLQARGVEDLDQYKYSKDPNAQLMNDLFID